MRVENAPHLLKKGLVREWKRVLLMVLFLMTGIGLQLWGPQLIQDYLDTVQAGGSVKTLTTVAFLFIGMTLLKQVIQIAETYVSENVGWAATNHLRQELALHSLRLDLSFYKEHSSGEMIERIDGDVSALANFFSRFVVKVLGNLLLVFGVVVVLLMENLWIGLAFAGFAIASLAVLAVIRDLATPYWVEARQASGEFYGFLGERLSGLEEIRANGGTGYVMWRFFRAMQRLLRTERNAYVRGRAMWPASIGLFAIGYLLVFGVGGTLLQNDVISMGTLYLMFNYMELLREPLDQITMQLQDYQKAAASVRRVQELLRVKSGIVDGTNRLPANGTWAVELDGVSFGYGEDAVLRDVSFKLEPGKVLGVLGRTGSGKSTLARLLFRLYDAKQGTIRLGGTDIRELEVTDLRQRIGMVTQEVRLFRASVRDNVTLFDPAMEDERIVSVLEEIGLGEWYHALPQGLDTLLEAGGGGMSAGQAQLLSFARVFLRDPQLVLLDEASSRLDPLTERLIERAMEKLLAGRTAILIAHRLQTIERADDILILDQGRVAEHGERKRLLADRDSLFAQWVGPQTDVEEKLA